MPIDPAVIQKDARADIADWPATIRHWYDADHYNEAQVNVYAATEQSILVGGGLVDSMYLSIYAILDDLIPPPQNRDRVDVLVKGESETFDYEDIDGKWQKMSVKRTQDYFDPLLPTVRFDIGTPDF